MTKSIMKTLYLRRNVVALLAFLGFCNVYLLRVNMSIAVVSMTKEYLVKLENGTEYATKDFDWSTKERGNILSSFFFGYILTQLFGGWLGTRIGGARVFGFGIAVTAVLTLVTPAAALVSTYLLVALRIIEGIFEGVTYPCIHVVWSNWAPPKERTRLASFAFSGSFFGTVIALPLCGMLSDNFGWSSVFYVPGICGVIWCTLWFIFVKEKPEQDPWITQEEVLYLKETMGPSSSKKIDLPWKSFMTSMPVWAITCAHFCENWGFYTLLTQLPTFLNDTMQYDIGKAGLLSALPYLVMAITLQIAGFLVDQIRKKDIMTNTQVRKLFNCGAFLSQTVFMTLAGFSDTPTMSILCLTMAVGLGAFAWAAFSVNHLDVAPQYAGVLMGISNTFATISGILAPAFAGHVTTHKTREEWRIVFFISSSIYLFGAVFYGIFASGERQPWAKDDTSIEKKSDKSKENHDENLEISNKAFEEE